MSRKKDRMIAYGAKMHEMGADCALFYLAQQFGVESRDIRDEDISMKEKAAVIAERIREKLREERTV